MTNDQQQVEDWRREFEIFYSSINDGFCPAQYDGSYDWHDAQNCWLSWLASKRNQPVIELPSERWAENIGDEVFIADDTCAAITAAGYSYKVKK